MSWEIAYGLAFKAVKHVRANGVYIKARVWKLAGSRKWIWRFEYVGRS